MSNITLDYKGCKIHILDGDYIENDKPAEAGIKFYTGLVESQGALKAFAASRLLSLYNETWLDEEIGKLDEKGFSNRLGNPRITLYNETGFAIVYFEDSGMFGGHCIEITINGGKPVKADLAG